MLSEKSKNFDKKKWPKLEQPKSEQPKSEWPKSEQAKSEQPKSKQPKSEKPKFPQITASSIEQYFLFPSPSLSVTFCLPLCPSPVLICLAIPK